MTIRQYLVYLEKILEENNLETSIAKILLMEYLNMNSSQLIPKFEEQIETGIQKKIEKALLRLRNNEPLQYIIGNEIFYGYKFLVNEDVLIPRFETEELVSYTLSYIDEYFAQESLDLADVGCGSGIIGITLKLEEPKLNVTLTDISEKSLVVAKNNALELNADVLFKQGDMLKPLKNMKFDIIISNPPYIPTVQDVASLVLDNEPHVALFGGIDGLFFYNEILQNVKPLLKEKYLMAFEIGYDQKDSLFDLATSLFPNDKIIIQKDLQEKDRMMFIISESLL